MSLALLSSYALKDYGLRSKTRGLFGCRARSISGAGASTNLMNVPPKTPRQHRKAQEPRTSPLEYLTLTSVHQSLTPNLWKSFEGYRPRPQSMPRHPKPPRPSSSLSRPIISCTSSSIMSSAPSPLTSALSIHFSRAGLITVPPQFNVP